MPICPRTYSGIFGEFRSLISPAIQTTLGLDWYKAQASWRWPRMRVLFRFPIRTWSLWTSSRVDTTATVWQHQRWLTSFSRMCRYSHTSFFTIKMRRIIKSFKNLYSIPKAWILFIATAVSRRIPFNSIMSWWRARHMPARWSWMALLKWSSRSWALKASLNTAPTLLMVKMIKGLPDQNVSRRPDYFDQLSLAPLPQHTRLYNIKTTLTLRWRYL